MEIFLSWKKGLFSNTYQFFENGIQVGLLKVGMWGNKANGNLNGKEFEFKTKGFFNQETIIIDSESLSIVGTIVYNTWRSKAIIKLPDGIECVWQYTNFWHSKWTVNKNLYFINYQGSFRKGEVISHIPDEVLIIAGLFVSNHFWQSSAAVAAT
ncbi:MAG: hypothetical protein EHM93_19010 [Bacteroidales bacterium]|nr:MAG: hypothetical protein EHM93_19010 [Bacteroidales bacterium]